MTKITIHRALAELKLADAKIEKAINNLQPIALKRGGKLTTSSLSEEDFNETAKKSFQSITDLLERKTVIKKAIVDSNAKTMVTVAGKEMTVADAITRKLIIQQKKQLIQRLKNEQSRMIGTLNVENEKVRTVAIENAKIMLGKQGDDRVKPTDKDVKAIMEPFIERNELKKVDPLDIEKTIEKFQTEVDEFETDVDAVLSESNAITFIEV